MRYSKIISLSACALICLASAAHAQSADPVIKLIEAGSGSKQPLRFSVKKGQSQSTEMIMKMGMETQVGPNKMPKMDLPAIKMVMKMDVLDVAGDGSFDYGFKLVSAEPMKSTGPMAEMMMNAMSTALKGIIGLGGKGKMTNRGINKGMQLEMPEQMDPQTKQMLDSMQDSMSRMSAPVPEEPIGVGGKWSVEQKVEQNGISINQKTIYRVKSMDKGKVVLDVSVEMNAPKQLMKAPGMPPNMKVSLEKMTGVGTGETTLNLSQAMPAAAKADITTTMKANMDMAGQQQPMNMNMSMELTLTSK